MSEHANDEERDETYYAVLLDAFVGSRMERDRSLMALSSGGIGLMVTLVSAFGARTAWEAALYAVTFLGFLACVLLTLRVFRVNADYTAVLLQRERATEPDPQREREEERLERRLDRLDGAVIWSFRIAVCAAAILGFALALTNVESPDGVHEQEGGGAGQHTELERLGQARR